ncbi:MAG: formate dehydrogenase subunit gamma [Desulfovibrionales bacterium]
MERQLKRHTRWDIFIHWFNALCWLVLLPTGIGLIQNEQLNPLGGWFPAAMRDLVGGGANLLLFHQVVGIIWVAGFVAYMIFNVRGTLFFLKEIFTVSPVRDTKWLVKKQIQMTLGTKWLKRLGMDPTIPEQGFYNMGQKVFAQLAVVGSVIIAITGVIMILSQTMLANESTWMVSWSIMLHYLFAGLVFAGLLVHVYMAGIAREERPAFKSMFTGTVPESYAKHHHRIWYDQERGESLKN